MRAIQNLLRNSSGATAVEYALIGALLLLGSIAVLGAVGAGLETLIVAMEAAMSPAPTSVPR